MNLNDFIQIGINLRSAESEGVLNISFHNKDRKIEVLIFSDYFKKYAESHQLEIEHNEGSELPVRLSFEYNNCIFFTNISEERYESEFKYWIESHDTPSEESVSNLPKGVTWQEEARKEAGMKEGDFQ